MEIKSLSEEQLIKNYEKLIAIAETYFSKERYDKVVKMFEHYGERLLTAPASGQTSNHGCYLGGYLEHVLTVIKFALQLNTLWNENGANSEKYTDEELVFSAMMHDLGKLGNKEMDFFVKNESDWHVKNQGKVFVHNSKLQNMPHEYWSLFILQQFEIEITENEYIAIMTHNGLFMDANKPFFSSYGDGKLMKNHLYILLHQADYMAYRIEIEKEGII